MSLFHFKSGHNCSFSYRYQLGLGIFSLLLCCVWSFTDGLIQEQDILGANGSGQKPFLEPINGTLNSRMHGEYF